MSTIASSSFPGASGTALAGIASDQGPAWTQSTNPNFNGTLTVDGSGFVYVSAGAVAAVEYIPIALTGTAFTITGAVKITGTPTSGSACGPFYVVSQSSGSGYELQVTAAGVWTLLKDPAGTTIGTAYTGSAITSTPATYTWTRDASGNHSVSIVDSGGTAHAAIITGNDSTYTGGYMGVACYANGSAANSLKLGPVTGSIPSATATTFTLTGPSSGGVAVPSTNFTVTPNGPYTGTITITPSGGGLSTPVVLTFSGSASPQTFTITPTSAGTVTITPTNNGGLTNPSNLTYTATATATTFTLTGPSAGTVGVASSNFTATPNAPYTGTITITPSGDGLSTPIVLTFSGSATPQNFTITPASAGAATLTPTNNGGLANPSNLTYTASAGSTAIAFGNAALYFSPYNWLASGTAYIESNTPGAYLKSNFTGTSIALGVNVAHLVSAAAAAANYPSIAWRIDGNPWQSHQLLSSDASISLGSGLAAGAHYVEVHMTGASYAIDRWSTPVSTLRVTGFTLDPAATVSAPPLLPGRAVIYGDSNSEGYEALGAGTTVANQDARQAWGARLGRAMGCEYGVIGFAGQGYTATGSGGSNVPTLVNAWNYYWSGQSRLVGGLFSPPPNYVISGHGENDLANYPAGSGVVAAATGLAASWRAAAPGAKAVFLTPPTNPTQLAASVAGTDPNTRFYTTGETYVIQTSGFTTGAYQNSFYHMNLDGQSRYASILGNQIGADTTDTSVTSDVTTALNGFGLAAAIARINLLALDSAGRTTPTPVESVMQRSGAAQGGSSTTIALDVGASSSDGSYLGHTISILSGTGSASSRQITGYVGATKVATVNRAWNTAPDSTSVYAIYKFIGPVLDGSNDVTLAAVQAFSTTGSTNINLAQAGLTPRDLTTVADGSLTVGDALVSAICGAAGKESIAATTYLVQSPFTGTTIRTFTLNSATSPTARS